MDFWTYSIEVQASVSSAYGLMLWSSGYTRESLLNIISYTKLAQFLHVPFNPVIHELRESGSHLFATVGLCYLSFCWTQWKVAKTASASSRSSQNLPKKVLTRHLYFIICDLSVPLLIDTLFYPVKSILFFWPAHSNNPLWDPSDRDPRKNHNQFCISSGCFDCGSTLSKFFITKMRQCCSLAAFEDKLKTQFSLLPVLPDSMGFYLRAYIYVLYVHPFLCLVLPT